MNQYAWEPPYAAAMLETIPSQTLIEVAEAAINARLQDSLNGQPISQQEVQAAKDALMHLRLLKRQAEESRLRA